MTIEIETASVSIEAAPVITLKGRGKSKREMAYMRLAPLSLVAGLSVQDRLDNIAVALGSSPSRREVETARTEDIIGKVAARLDGEDDVERLTRAREIVCQRASPDAKRVGKDQTGRRTPDQQRVFHAAKQQFSSDLAIIAAQDNTLRSALQELGYAKAATPKQNNSKRAAAMKGSTKRGKKDAQAPTALQLVESAKPLSAADANNHVLVQLAALTKFCHKHGSLVAGDLGDIVRTANAGAVKVAGQLAEQSA